MERNILLLGLIRMGVTYGYQLNEFIESHMRPIVQLKKPTAYSLLNKMVNAEWITAQEEKSGNRPPRRVYSITEEGEAAFNQMVCDSLERYHPDDMINDVSIMFLDSIPTDKAISLINRRKDRIRELIEGTMTHAEAHEGGFSLVIDHARRHLQTDLEWLDEVIQELEWRRESNAELEKG